MFCCEADVLVACHRMVLFTIHTLRVCPLSILDTKTPVMCLTDELSDNLMSDRLYDGMFLL